MKAKDIKKEYEAYVNQECKIHIDKPKGHDKCAMTVLGDTVSIQTMLASLTETLVKHGVLRFEDLRHTIDIVEKAGVKYESK